MISATSTATPARAVRRLAAALGAAGLAAALASCSSLPGGDSDDLTWEDSPLNEYWEQIYGTAEIDQEEQEAEWEAQDRQREELVAQCMAEQGFDYTPNVQSGGVYYYDDSAEGLDPIEYAQQYGYGIYTWEDMYPQDESEGEWVDANADVYESMSDSEREAWDRALYGEDAFVDMSDWTEEEMLEYEQNYEWDWETAGCYGYAENEIWGYDEEGETNDPYSDPRFAELIEAMNSLYEDAASDPRVSELSSEWATCMANAGFPGFSSPEEPWEAISNLSNEFYEGLGELTDEDWAAGLGDPSDELMAEWKEQEIATAVADYTCQDEIDYQNTQLEVQFELEREFIDTYRADLDAFAAAYGDDA